MLRQLCGVLAGLTITGLTIAQEADRQDSPQLPGIQARVELAIEDATRWLLENQKESGAWGSHHSPRPIEIFCDVPGSHNTFRLGSTSLGVMALWDVIGPSKETDGRVRRAIDCAVDHILEDWDVKRPSGLEHYSVWAYGYGLEALAEHLMKAPELIAEPEGARAQRIRKVCAGMIERLGALQDLDGGWGYLTLGGIETQRPSWTSMSFTTATCMLGLSSAREAGIQVPEKIWKKALKQVKSCRTPVGSYTYGKLWNSAPARGINDVKGGACRTPLCNLAIEEWGQKVAQREHIASLENLLIKHARMQILSLKRPIPHESWYSISGYFYLYGHAYAARVMESLGKHYVARFSEPLAEAVLVCRQPDGSFWDYPLYSYHKPYGTALALSALTRCRFDDVGD